MSAVSDTQTFIPVYDIVTQRFGNRPSPQSIHRWVRKGVAGGVRLQAVRHGGTWHCKPEWFDEFIQAQTDKVLSSESEANTATEADLEAAGIL